jgi:hypothetical protein
VSTNPGTHLWSTTAWTHWAVTGDGAKLYAFVDGVKVIETPYTKLNTVTSQFEFFRNTAGSNDYGQLDECRITFGVCRYTAGFTPPSSAFFNTGPAFNTNVALLLQMNGADGTTTFVDSSPSNKTVSVAGSNVTMAAAAAKYGISGARFGGTGGRLRILHDSSLTFSGDFTIAFHVNSTTLDNPQNSFKILMTKAEGGGFYPFRIARDNSDRITATGYYQSPSSAFNIVSSSSVTANTWYHIALTSTGNVVRLFVDGVQQGSSATLTNSLHLNTNAPISLGAYEDGGSTNAFTGDIDNVIVVNQSLYSSNFTPPTAPYTNFV